MITLKKPLSGAKISLVTPEAARFLSSDRQSVKGEKTDEKDRAPEGYKTVQVETGISNDMFVEIISGLNEGDSVYVTPSAGGEQQMMFPGMGGMSGMGGMPGGMSGGNRTGGMSGGNRTGGMPGGGGMR